MSQQNKFIHLFVQHYEAKSPVGRQDEINDALRKNLAHPNVARVYYLSEHLGTASNDPALKAAKYDEWTKEEKQKLHFVSSCCSSGCLKVGLLGGKGFLVFSIELSKAFRNH